MKTTYGGIMEVIEAERYQELLCAEKSKCLMKKTLNPIRKIRCYFDAKRFMNHVFGMDLVIRKLQKTMKES